MTESQAGGFLPRVWLDFGKDSRDLPFADVYLSNEDVHDSVPEYLSRKEHESILQQARAALAEERSKILESIPTLKSCDVVPREDLDKLQSQLHASQAREREAWQQGFYASHPEEDPNPGIEIPCGKFVGEKEVQHLLAEERAKGLDAVIVEAKRKQKVINMPSVGHSAQSFGQHWAYDEIIEFCEKAKAAREGEG